MIVLSPASPDLPISGPMVSSSCPHRTAAASGLHQSNRRALLKSSGDLRDPQIKILFRGIGGGEEDKVSRRWWSKKKGDEVSQTQRLLPDSSRTLHDSHEKLTWPESIRYPPSRAERPPRDGRGT